MSASQYLSQMNGKVDVHQLQRQGLHGDCDVTSLKLRFKFSDMYYLNHSHSEPVIKDRKHRKYEEWMKTVRMSANVPHNPQQSTNHTQRTKQRSITKRE